jgi:hypothetical protein
MESRQKNKITPKENNKDHIFKVSFNKDDSNPIAIKKVAFPDKE